MATVNGLAHADGAPRSVPVLSWLNKQNRGYYLAGYLLLFILGAWTAFPFYWQIATSFRLDVDLYTPVVALIPHVLTLDHYNKVLFGASRSSCVQFTNSLVVAIATTLIAVRSSARWPATP